MSYLEMSSAPLPDMNSGIISLWFRDLSGGTTPEEDKWPSGQWTEGGTSMLPPDTTQIVKTMPTSVFYWSAYGIPTAGAAGAVFYGPATVIMPSPPPLSASTIRMLLTFGDANQSYDYCPWQVEYPNVINAVSFITSPDIIYRVTDFPPPYKPYWKTGGTNGKYVVTNMKLGTPEDKSGMVPQSFIGISEDGYLTICLQTKTKAEYKGYAYQIDRVTEIWATQTIFQGVPPTTVIKIPGYWDGYQFWYEDISNKVMSAQPECFILGGARTGLDFPLPPRVNDKTWHHLLFSFDIDGKVTSVLPEVPIDGGMVTPPNTKTECKAWVALDDKNYTGNALQHSPLIPNGISSPQLPGMGVNGVFPFGPNANYNRDNLGLGPNDIVPQNVWVRGFWGNPRDGLPRYTSAAGMAPGNPYVPEGNFNFLVYTGVEWVLAGRPADGLGSIDPAKPNNPDPPKDLDVPQYKCPGFSIPIKGNSIGIPVSAHHLKHNTGVEMGELQIWANQTLDTGDAAMRRLFIDKNGKPVNMKKAEEALGKPDVKLRGTSNWKIGKNTGTAGMDSAGKLIKAGQFKPTAKIEKFKPDPQIGK